MTLDLLVVSAMLPTCVSVGCIVGLQVRVWDVGKSTRKLEEVMKEHISSISCIKVKKNNQECVTASIDGTCIIWDLV